MARAGDVISYETSHPVIFQADQPYESLVVRVPRQLLGREEAQISGCTALGISGTEGLPRAAVAFFRSADRRVGGRDDHGCGRRRTPSSVWSISSAACTRRRRQVRETVRLRTRTEILLNIQAFIEANLDDPYLDPERIARASFISTRYLHKLFEAEGTSVCRWIRTTRLERCRRDLLDPALDHETILAIASRWGLPGPQQFSRLFRSAYGCSPSELRRQGRWATPN